MRAYAHARGNSRATHVSMCNDGRVVDFNASSTLAKSASAFVSSFCVSRISGVFVLNDITVCMRSYDFYVVMCPDILCYHL